MEYCVSFKCQFFYYEFSVLIYFISFSLFNFQNMLFTKPAVFLPRTFSFRTIYNKSRTGLREVVGFGVNGSNVYKDDAHFPFPSIRFQETRGMIIVCLSFQLRVYIGFINGFLCDVTTNLPGGKQHLFTAVSLRA